MLNVKSNRVKFPHPLTSKSFTYKLVLKLRLNVKNFSFLREYYKVQYDNGTELIFLTSNELDENYESLHFRKHFSVFFSLNQLMKDFSYIPLMDIYMSRKEHILHFPNYLFYEPEFIDASLFDLFILDIYDRFEEQHDNQRLAKTIKLWKNKLK